jgi:putative oxidoreductase
MTNKPNSDTDRSTRDVALLAMRLMLGAVFIFHGSQKLFGWFGGQGLSGMTEFLKTLNVPMPAVNAVLAACAEFFGGLAVLLGLATRMATVPMIVTMLVASFVVHKNAFSAQNGGMEYPLTLAVMLFSLALMGPGRLTLLRLIRQKS